MGILESVTSDIFKCIISETIFTSICSANFKCDHWKWDCKKIYWLRWLIETLQLAKNTFVAHEDNMLSISPSPFMFYFRKLYVPHSQAHHSCWLRHKTTYKKSETNNMLLPSFSSQPQYLRWLNNSKLKY